MNRIILTIGCLVMLSFLNAEEEIVVVDSDLADYDGKKITLSGNVVVRHEMGTIAANHMMFHQTSDTPGLAYGKLQMDENVKISLKDGGQISCSHADLDYRQLEGLFAGSPSQDYVVYTENCRSKGEQGIPLVIKGRRMAVQLLRSDAKALEFPKSVINTMSVEENVTVNYAHDFIAVSDTAFYQRNAKSSEQGVDLPGTITLKAAEKGGVCQLTNREGDNVRANLMSIDTLQRQLDFISVNGRLKEEKLEFKANKLLWDEQAQVLTLQEDVEVIQPGYGKLVTDDEVRLYKNGQGEGKQLRAIESLSNTQMIYYDLENHLHTLTCHGKIFVDHTNLIAVLESPTDDAKKQVEFEDSKGEIFADKVTVKYGMPDQKVTPEKIILEGNVRILNHYAPNQEKVLTVLQYALADAVEYTPATEEMVFTSKGKKRVLFFDKINNLQVSAPKLIIRRDQSTQKETIQGMGEVRFSFIEKEFEQLRQKFSMLEKFGSS